MTFGFLTGIQRMRPMIPQSDAISVEEAIFSGDGARLRDALRSLLIRSVSYYDTAG